MHAARTSGGPPQVIKGGHGGGSMGKIKKREIAEKIKATKKETREKREEI